jgi:hypothetical protein
MQIVQRKPFQPLLIQAKDFLGSFGLSVDGMLHDEEFEDMRGFIYERSRGSVMSFADTFALAKNYALRIPEWQWHSFQYIFSQLEVETGDRNWVSMATEYAAEQPNPVVMVFRSPIPVPIPDPIFAKFMTGGEISPPVPNPLPAGYELLAVVEIDRNPHNQ